MANQPSLKIAQPPPEFSRPLKVTAITQRLDTISVEATPEECAALALRFDLPVLEQLSATLEYRRLTGTQRIRIDGVISAQTAQYCVESWDQVPETIREPFVADFTQTVWETADTEMDQPEIITEDVIDLGELVAQYFYLALNPYPRAAIAAPPPEKPKRMKKSPLATRTENKPLNKPANKNSANAATATIEDFVATISNASAEPAEFLTPSTVIANDIEPSQNKSSLFHQYLQKLSQPNR